MKRFVHYLFAGVGVLLIGLSHFLRQGSADVHTAVTNLASSFMFGSGIVCFVVGIILFFIKDDTEEW